jgi:hypothetical protein
MKSVTMNLLYERTKTVTVPTYGGHELLAVVLAEYGQRLLLLLFVLFSAPQHRRSFQAFLEIPDPAMNSDRRYGFRKANGKMAHEKRKKNRSKVLNKMRSYDQISGSVAF